MGFAPAARAHGLENARPRGERLRSIRDLFAHHPHVLERCLGEADDELRAVKRRLRALAVAGEVAKQSIRAACFDHATRQIETRFASATGEAAVKWTRKVERSDRR